eukprot:1216544-Heterocapsa_arctica.AAC.1
MLIGVMMPKWTGRLDAFADELRAWKLAVLRYEEGTGVPMLDEVRCSAASRPEVRPAGRQR